MDWFYQLFSQGGVAQTILLLTLISVIGLILGRIRFGSVSLGSSFVFFAAIAAGHFAGKFGIQTNAAMMDLAKNFGLVVFVYMLGLQVGPGFFPSLKKGGGRLVISAVSVILLGSAGAVLLVLFAGFSGPEAVGLLSGAVTNTPSLITAQQTILDISPQALEASNTVGAAYAVAYPFSIFTILICITVMKKASGNKGNNADKHEEKDTAAIEVSVLNEEVCGKSLHQIVVGSGFHFVVSRLWRDNAVQIPMSETTLQKGDRLLIICEKEDFHRFGDLFGKESDKDWNSSDIDWNIIDKNLVSKEIRVTREDVIGLTLGQMKLRNKYGVNITRLSRAGITLVPSANTAIQFGDRITVVGDEGKIKILEKAVGNEVRMLDAPHLVPILAGIFLGVFIGCVPLHIPGISMPVKLGIAGGPILVGILMGAFGARLRINTYTTKATNLMVRDMGITFFFAALGLSVGGDFVSKVFCLQGIKWAAAAILLSGIPFILVGIMNEKWLKTDFSKSVGCLCGAMTNPNALNYANSILGGSRSSEAYATVYPVVIFLRVLAAQALVFAIGI